MPSSQTPLTLSGLRKVARLNRFPLMLLIFFALSACSTIPVSRGCNPELLPDQPRPRIRVAPAANPTWGDVFGLAVDESKTLDKYRCRDAAIRGEPPPMGC